jgi:hypothetical protein
VGLPGADFRGFGLFLARPFPGRFIFLPLRYEEEVQYCSKRLLQELSRRSLYSVAMSEIVKVRCERDISTGCGKSSLIRLTDAVATANLSHALQQMMPSRWNGVCVLRQESPTVSHYLMARHKRPGISVLFTARPEFARHAEGVGEFMPVPIDLTELVAAVGRLLRADC